jgi:hypothetical protein
MCVLLKGEVRSGIILDNTFKEKENHTICFVALGAIYFVTLPLWKWKLPNYGYHENSKKYKDDMTDSERF